MLLQNKNIDLKIVIVDDSPDDHFFIKESLCEFPQIRFISFYNGKDFLNYLLEKKEKGHDSRMPDIVILDINMPKLSGFEVFQKVVDYKLEENINFFILTTDLTDKDIENCSRLHLQCHRKPFSIEAFGILLQEMIVDAGLDGCKEKC